MTVNLHGVADFYFSVNQFFKVKIIFFFSAYAFNKIIAASAGINSKACSRAAESAVNHFIESTVAAAGNKADLFSLRNGVLFAEANGIARAFGKIDIYIFFAVRKKIANIARNIVCSAAFPFV